MKKYLALLLFTVAVIAACNTNDTKFSPNESYYELTETNFTIPIQKASNETQAYSTLQDTLSTIIANGVDSLKTNNLKINIDKILADPNMKMQLTELNIQNNTSNFSDYLSSIKSLNFDESTAIISVKKDKYPTFINEALPKSFTDRIFIRNLAAFAYDIFQLPGNIVEMMPDSNLKLKTLVSTTKKNFIPKQTVLDNEIIYDNKINDKASFNGSFLIGGLSVEKDRMMEVLIQDIAKSTLPDSVIDDKKLITFLKKIPSSDRKRLYFVKGALLTIINNKKYDKTSYTAKINSTWLTADGNIFKEADKFSKERLVSLDLISLDDVISMVTL